MLIPRVCAFFLEPLHHVSQRQVILEPLPATLAIENDDRHPPEALPRNAPVWPLLDHLVHAVFAPRGNPLHLVNFFQRFLAQRFFPAPRVLVHFYEPLLVATKNHRIVSTPPIRIGLLVLLIFPK